MFSSINDALAAFERVRVARDYPTPRSALAYYRLLGVLFPMLLAPVYVHESVTESGGHSGGVKLHFMCPI